MKTYQKIFLFFGILILYLLCLFIYIQKSDDVVVISIISYLQWEEKWAEDWFIVARKSSSNPEKAIKYYSSAIKFNPNFSEAYSGRGWLKYRFVKDYKGAIQDFTKAIELNPSSSNSYYNRGAAKYYLQDYRGAMQDFTKAIELNPNTAGPYIFREILNKGYKTTP